MKKCLFGLLLSGVVILNSSIAQQFGGLPPSTRWQQINTDTARIIFPAGYDSIARQVSAMLHSQAAANNLSLGSRIKKINIVLQSRTTIPNGYVSPGPYRSEFYMTPPASGLEQGSIPWMQQLTFHEYRHVQQYNNFYNGISRLMGTLFGQEGYAVAVNAAIPNWFFEGDAVYTETILTQQGRGSLPAFLNPAYALFSEKKKYSWMKLRNGSLKDYVPNHYETGYILTKFGYEKYGPDFWKKVTADASSFKGLFYPFQKAVNKYSGQDYKSFYQEALFNFGALRKDLLEQNNQAITKMEKTGTTSAIFTPNKKYVTNRVYPFAYNNELLYVKNSYRQRSTFVKKDSTGKETPIRVKDISLDDHFSYKNGKVVYSAYEDDARWGWIDYSNIRVLDLATQKQIKLTSKSRYFTPDISEDGSVVVAVNNTTGGKSELHVINVTDKQIVQKITATDGTIYTEPKFINNDSVITALRLPDGKMGLAVISLKNNETYQLLPPSHNTIGNPVAVNDTIYFTASFNGNNNIFATTITGKEVYQLTNENTGAYFGSAGNGKLYWSSFSAEGYQLHQQLLASMPWLPLKTADLTSLSTNIARKPGVNKISDISHNKTIDYAVTPYKKTTGLINLHSWRPNYSAPEYSFTIYGQNILNTFQPELYYVFNENDKSHTVGAAVAYGQWFPQLNIGGQYSMNRNYTIRNRTKQWNEGTAYAGLSLPLNWSRGTINNQLSIGSNFHLRQDANFRNYKDSFATIGFTYLNHYFNFSQTIQRARQHIYPRMGYAVSVNQRHATTGYTSWQTLLAGTLYLPGILRTHNFIVNGGFQETDTISTLFGNRMAYARGYNAQYYARTLRSSFNYHMPLFYPDWGFGNILYCYRLRSNLFFDNTLGFSRDKTATINQRSTGIELYADTNWWNQYPLSFGIRVSKLLDKELGTNNRGVVFEFILPMIIPD